MHRRDRIPSPECTRNRRFRSARDFSRPRQHRPQPVPGSPSESQPVPASPTRCSGRLERAGAGRVTRCVTEMHTIKPASNWKEGNRKMPRRASRACSRRNPTGNLPCNTANGLQRELQLHSASTHTSLPHTTRPGRSDRCQGRNEAQHAPPRPFLRRDQGLHIRGASEIMDIMGFGRPIKKKTKKKTWCFLCTDRSPSKQLGSARQKTLVPYPPKACMGEPGTRGVDKSRPTMYCGTCKKLSGQSV